MMTALGEAVVRSLYMAKASAGSFEDTAQADVLPNLASFGRRIRAANKSPLTIKAYSEAIPRTSWPAFGRRRPGPTPPCPRRLAVAMSAIAAYRTIRDKAR